MYHDAFQRAVMISDVRHKINARDASGYGFRDTAQGALYPAWEAVERVARRGDGRESGAR